MRHNYFKVRGSIALSLLYIRFQNQPIRYLLFWACLCCYYLPCCKLIVIWASWGAKNKAKTHCVSVIYYKYTNISIFIYLICIFLLPKQIKWEFMFYFFSVLYMYSDVLQSYYFFASYLDSPTLIHPLTFPTFRVVFEKESYIYHEY